MPSFFTVISSRDHWYFDVLLGRKFPNCFSFHFFTETNPLRFCLELSWFVDWKLLLLFKTSQTMHADTNSSTYYKRCCVTAIWFILLILPVTWSLFAFERYVGKEMKKSKLRFKQMFLPSISSVTDENNEL